MGHKPDRKARARRAAKAKITGRERGKRPLPEMWQGAKVVRGEGMNSDKLDTLLEREALDTFHAMEPMYLVVEDNALEDLDDSTQIAGFRNEEIAITVAKARSHGNVNHRVLKVVEQTLVIATMNDL